MSSSVSGSPIRTPCDTIIASSVLVASEPTFGRFRLGIGQSLAQCPACPQRRHTAPLADPGAEDGRAFSGGGRPFLPLPLPFPFTFGFVPLLRLLVLPLEPFPLDLLGVGFDIVSWFDGMATTG